MFENNNRDYSFENYSKQHMDYKYAEKLTLFAKIMFALAALIIIFRTPSEIQNQTIQLCQYIIFGHAYAIILSLTALLSISKYSTKLKKITKILFYLTGFLLIIFFTLSLTFNPFTSVLNHSLIPYVVLTPFLYVLLYFTVFQKNYKFSQILSLIILLIGFTGFFYFLQSGTYDFNLAFHFIIMYSFIGIGFISSFPTKGVIKTFCLNTSSSRLARYLICTLSILVILLLVVFFVFADLHFQIIKNFLIGAFVATCVLAFIYLVIFIFVKQINENDMNRVIAEEKSQEREELFEQLINFTNDAVLVTNKEDEIVYANPNFYEYLSVQKGTIVGKNFLDPSLNMFKKKKEYLKAKQNLTTESMKDHAVGDENIILRGYIIPIIKNEEYDGMVQVAVDVTEFKENESNLKSSMDLMNVLLTEVHHRVKNNMQIIISLLNLQKYQIDDPTVRNALDESKSRIKAMSLVHENLYVTGNFSEININEYTKLLLENLKTQFSYIPNLTFNQNVIDYNIDLDTAIPLGLIINEIITGSIYYGFDNGDFLKENNITGIINVNLSKKDEEFKLQIYDNGHGINHDHVNDYGITRELVAVLADQLDGKSKINLTANGFEFILKFSIKPIKKPES